ncbi:PqqD family protein [Intrasporangium calvum]|nr:PqqD family protein [Intrasporangium calvum]
MAYVVVDGEEPPEVSPEDPELYLMRLPDGPPVRLGGTAAVIWLVASAGEEDVVEAVARLVERDPVDIEPDVMTYLDLLVADGLLERARS